MLQGQPDKAPPLPEKVFFPSLLPTQYLSTSLTSPLLWLGASLAPPGTSTATIPPFLLARRELIPSSEAAQKPALRGRKQGRQRRGDN
mgnify:CR=1 FL=1